MKYIRGTYHLSKAGFECDEVRSLLLRRGLQVLVHSCIYYKFADSIVPDSTWNAWAKELYQLQKEYPRIAERVDYHNYFRDFSPSTGFDLPIGHPEIMNKAKQLIEMRDKDEKRSSVDISRSRKTNQDTIHFEVCKGSLIISPG